jgi:hypothetical protein
MSTLLGIVFALAAAATTNIAFLYKYRGACAASPVNIRRPLCTAKSLLASPLFAIGMGIAVVAWLLHVAAISLAPLSLVQTVIAGGVVFIAVVADKMFGMRVGHRQWMALCAMGCGLILLAVTLRAPHGANSHFSVRALLAFDAGLTVAAVLFILGGSIGTARKHSGVLLGSAAGILFGVCDISIKAISGVVGSDGLLAFVTPWSVVGLASAVAAFYGSAKAFQLGDAVPVISITGAAANLSGVLGGLVVFGDPLPPDPAGRVIQCCAFIAVILAAAMMPAPVCAQRSGAAVVT